MTNADAHGLTPGSLAIFSCTPVDTRALRRLLPDVPIPRPSIEHTLTTCDLCGQDVWIGPTQLAKLRSLQLPLVGVTLCTLCTFASARREELANPVSLNPNEADVPRR